MQTATNALPKRLEIRENGTPVSTYHFPDLALGVLRCAQHNLPASVWTIHDRTGRDVTDELAAESWEAGEAAYLDEQTERALLLQA